MNNKQLDMVLGYLNEGTEINKEEFLNESSKISSPIISKDGKNYEIIVPPEIKKEAESALKILIDKMKQVQKSEEYKKAKKILKKNGINDSNSSLIEIVRREIIDYYDGWYLQVGVSNKMSQDMFYAEYEKGKHIYNLTDAAYKELENNTKITKLPHFKNFFNGDDFYAIDIAFRICGYGEEQLKEIKK